MSKRFAFPRRGGLRVYKVRPTRPVCVFIWYKDLVKLYPLASNAGQWLHGGWASFYIARKDLVRYLKKNGIQFELSQTVYPPQKEK